MLSSWIWLCALSKAVMAIRQPEDDQALQQEVEFFDRPLTPSFRPEMLISDDEKVPPIPSALLEQQGCSKQYKSTGKLLGKGNWGTVYEVEEQGSKCRFWRRCQKKRFALKMVSASSQQGKAVMEHEAQVMLAANQHSCSHVIPMITVCVHHGLKDQLLPAEDFRYGIRGQKGASTEDTMKAGLLLGVAAYQNEVAESVYESSKKEPLGKPWSRGHSLKMLPEGFGNPSGTPQDGKEVIYAIHQKPDTEDNRLLYKYTHNNFNPGERIERKYRWPAETEDSRFRFGHGLGQPQEGAGARLALNWEVEDDGSVRKTRLVQKNAEDFRNVHHTKVYHKSHPMQGANGPPLDPDFRHGVKSGISDYTAKSCIQGYYSLEEQLPDQDLGRCLKPGRRNVTVATRAFGVPSVRTDIPAPPPDKRSIADNCSYGDECSAAALLNPQRFDDRGVPDRDFLIRRPKDELRALVESCDVEGVDFDALWNESVPLFDDGLPLVSLDAMLFVHTKKLEDRVAALHTGTGPGLAAYKGAL